MNLVELQGEGNGNPLQYSCLGNPIHRGAWWATVHGVARSRTRLSDFTFTFHFHALEKKMATHSSILAWRIPGTGAWWAVVYGVAQSRTRLTWLSSSSSRVARYKMSTKKSAVFLYTSNENFENEIKKNPICKSPKSKISKDNLNQGDVTLYTGNYKTLLKETLKDL